MKIDEEIITRYAAGRLLQLIVERIHRHRRDEEGKAFRATLVELHNTGMIDVLEPARAIATSPISQHEFFLVQDVYVDIIPELQSSIPAMLAAVKALVARAGNDSVSGAPNGAFRKWMEVSDRARTTIAILNPTSTEDAAYFYLALLAMAKAEAETALERAIAFLGSGNVSAQLGAAKAIGDLSLDTAEARAQSLDALEAAREACIDDNLLGHIVAAAAEIARKAPDEEAAVLRLVGAVAEHAGAQAVHHAVSTLMFHACDLPFAIVAALTRVVHKIDIENRRTVEWLDNASAALLRHNRVDEALALVVPVLSAHQELCSLDNSIIFLTVCDS